MTTRRTNITATAGWNVYLAAYRLSDGKIFDWNDNTWKLLSAPPTTPGLAMTSVVTIGSALAEYVASVNLALLNNSTTPMDVVLVAFHRLGGSVAIATDTPIGEGESISVALGDIVVTNGPLGTGFQVIPIVDLTTTSGTNAHVKVRLADAAGQRINLNTVDPSATCTVNIQRDGVHNQFTLSTSDFGAPNANGWFEADYANPAFATDVGFTAIATIVTGGVSYEGECDFYNAA